jgi:hypothetical protein
VAEILREEFSGQVSLIVGSIISWESNWCLLSSSPFAFWDVANSFSIHTDAHFDGVNIVSNISWGAEVMIWDQGFSVTPHACSVLKAISGFFSEAHSELSFSCVGFDRKWVAELFGEEWSLSGWSRVGCFWNINP